MIASGTRPPSCVKMCDLCKCSTVSVYSMITCARGRVRGIERTMHGFTSGIYYMFRITGGK